MAGDDTAPETETKDDQLVSLFGDEDDAIFGDEDSDDEDELLEEGSVKVAREDIKLMNVVRAIVILFLLTVATIFGEAVFIITLIGEERSFEDAFEKTSNNLIEALFAKLNNDLWIAKSLSTDLALSAAQDEDSNWPFISYQDFDSRCKGPIFLSDASSIKFAPLVKSADHGDWEGWATQSYEPQPSSEPEDGVEFFSSYRSVDQGIFAFNGGFAQDVVADASLLSPVWQMYPAHGNQASGLIGTMFDEISNDVRNHTIESMLGCFGATMTPFQYGDTSGNDFVTYTVPRATVYYPIFGNDGVQSTSVTGSVAFEFSWEALLNNVLEEGTRDIVAVIENSCGGEHSFNVRGKTASFMGVGDLHDDDVDGYESVSSSYTAFNELFAEHRRLTAIDPCSYRVNLYATVSYKDYYVGSDPEVYRGIVLAVFIFVVAIFILYDCLVERRQSRVVTAAQRSDAIVRSLFPSNVRNRLYEQAKAKELAEREREKEAWKNSKNMSSNSSLGEGALIETPKIRLKSFISSGSALPEDQMPNNHQVSVAMEPIADLFPHTTIMFADIAGFTAWSSEREPSQVFTLLETIYRDMDKAAKKLNVFKVETVGDCYVAATGIPDPQENHAEIMVRFARSCLLRIDLLTKELESQLGPGTAELAMRFGIHTGPVTAGVLRGQKARFQLFGDTMNTASRMESTGMKNKIHLSTDTADKLTKAGFGHWITKRQDLVHVKGKGDMQTYWLLLGSSSMSETSSVISDDTSGLGALIRAPRSRPRKNKASFSGTGLDGVLGVTEIDDSLQRLIDWNVDVLITLLKRVVANRIATGVGSKALSTSAEKSLIGNGLVLDDVQMVIDLPEFDHEVALKASNEAVELVPEVKKELVEFVSSIASGYPKNAFHNFEHASHVILSSNKLLKRVMAADDIATTEKEALTSKELHDHTYGIGTDPITHFAVVFSSLIHDVGHPGVPNGRLAQEDPKLARKYVNKSIAEQHSVDIAWELLLLPKFKNLRACIYQDRIECKRFRDLVVNSVMATDIFDKELKALRNSRWDMAFAKKEIEKVLEKEDVDRKATIVIEHIIQASDVSHTMQHWYIYLKWNERLYREMYFAFLAGRSQKDPSEGWFEGELWFFDNYVIPLAKKLRNCGVFGVSCDEYLTYALQNRVEWEKKGKDVCKKMKSRAEEEARSLELLKQIGEEEEEEEQEVEESALAKAGGKAAVLDETNTRAISVPPGKLGIVIDTNDDGNPIVHHINDESPLKNKLNEGDTIVSIDGVDTKGMNSATLSTLIASGANRTRSFVLATGLDSIVE
eukprot:CAMPEP_0168820572 /NCGR_PEP_ID=MMETSP0726-20121227/8918_1 /TAXON_ID=265536 /ORGANISM="Amphiprora sp., Strain CCMP467" /LENGTH=1298 /DNA_ID=CAMNT_0008873087 /DNA_START=52 /DNA_END=3948 /DNA_ORIENTATION=-